MMEREWRDLSFVPRWVIARTLKQQSVAEHSFYVALYAEQLGRMLNWRGDYALLLRYALVHDAEECFMGDTPGPIKAQVVDSSKFNMIKYRGLNKRFVKSMENMMTDPPNEVRMLIKLADGLDEAFYLATEIQLGNQAVRDIFDTRCRWLRDKLYDYLPTFGLGIQEKINFWEEINQMINNHLNKCSQVVHGDELEPKGEALQSTGASA